VLHGTHRLAQAGQSGSAGPDVPPSTVEGRDEDLVLGAEVVAAEHG
jgi:hypothetical protein